jgi:hypothetical protein
MELHGDHWNIQEPPYEERSEQAKLPCQLKSTSKTRIFLCLFAQRIHDGDEAMQGSGIVTDGKRADSGREPS